MTGRPPAGDNGRGTYARRSRFWQIAFRIFYRFLRLVDPLIRSSLALGLPGLGGVVDLHVPGRRSGRDRRVLVTLLHLDKGWYVGHPNGETAWTRNLEAAGVARVDPPPAGGAVVQVVRLPLGPERDAVVRATRTQQPFPGNLFYRAANRHIAAVGVYFRLVLS